MKFSRKSAQPRNFSKRKAAPPATSAHLMLCVESTSVS
jgi:hypothetical protein